MPPPPEPDPPPLGRVVVVVGTVVVGTVGVDEPLSARLFSSAAMPVSGALRPLTPGGAPSAAVEGEALATVDVVVEAPAAEFPWW